MLVDVERALDALFDEDEIACEVICPTQLYPLDPRPILESVRRTGRLLIAEEGLGFAAFGAEVVAQIMERAPGVAPGTPPSGVAGAPDPLVRAAGEAGPAGDGPRRRRHPGALRIMSGPVPDRRPPRERQR